MLCSYIVGIDSDHIASNTFFFRLMSVKLTWLEALTLDALPPEFATLMPKVVPWMNRLAMLVNVGDFGKVEGVNMVEWNFSIGWTMRKCNSPMLCWWNSPVPYVDADVLLFGRGWLRICHVVMENLEFVSEWNHLYHVYPRVTLNGITEIHAKYSIDT